MNYVYWKFFVLQNIFEILHKSQNISLSLVLRYLTKYWKFFQINSKLSFNFSKTPSEKSEIFSKFPKKFSVMFAKLLIQNVFKNF